MGSEIKLKVRADQQGSKVAFTLDKDGDLPPGVDLDGSTLKIKKDAPTNNLLTFKLKDGNLRLSYADEPIWVARGTTCPRESGLGGFRVERVHGDSLTVRVPDDPSEFGYTLRFRTAQGQNCEFDPIIMNRL